MPILEIAGYQTGVDRSGVDFLQPSDAFNTIEDGFIHREVLQSRRGMRRFVQDAVTDGKRIIGIYNWEKKDGTTELLVFSQDYLYRFSSGSWTQIAPAGAAPATFGITDDNDYITGTTYPDASNTDRFVFTSRTLGDVLFYDGTNVKSFTDGTDNSDYQAPAAGALTGATHIRWFGDRLCLFNPILAAAPFPQNVLYSGIRVNGNGDKFQAVGAGRLEASTTGELQTVQLFGNFIVAGFTETGYWRLEITNDPFNPFIWRRIPSNIGVNAPFSSVSWGQLAVALGRRGILGTDSRQSFRTDNKIPNFTLDDVENDEFDYSAGGVLTERGQFLWSYVSSAEEASTQDRLLVYNYEEQNWSTYKQRLTVFGNTFVGEDLTWDDIDETNDPSWATWDTTTDIWDKIGIGSLVPKTLAGDDEGFVYQIDVDADDYYFAVTDITTGSDTEIEVGDHPFKVGDQVVVTGVVGLTDGNGNSGINNYDPTDGDAIITPYTITAISSTTVTVAVDSSGLTAYDSAGSVIKVINFRARTIPLNPFRDQGRKMNLSHVEVLLNTTVGAVFASVYADGNETPFIKRVPLVPRGTLNDREFVTFTVNSEANFFEIEYEHLNPGSIAEVTSTRLHFTPGGLTSG